ncbi:MAG: lysophospholipid acyltransferase family protein [Chlorobiota bacterium]
MWTGDIVGYGLRAAAIIGYTIVASTWAFLLPPRIAHRRLLEAVPGWAQTMLRLCGVRVVVEGAEHLRQLRGPVVYVCNHASLLDIPVLIAALPDRLCFLYKKSLQRVPFFGWVLRRMPYVPITRRSTDALQQLSLAVAYSRWYGLSPVVFPEGGRSFDGTVRPFKRGALILAQRLRCPIVPVAIAGTHALLPPHTLRFRPGTARVRIGAPIETPPATDRAAQQEFLQSLRHRIATWLEEMSNTVGHTWNPA